jgi:hypothetical protein
MLYTEFPLILVENSTRIPPVTYINYIAFVYKFSTLVTSSSIKEHRDYLNG